VKGKYYINDDVYKGEIIDKKLEGYGKYYHDDELKYKG
jgi:hypothetical protein